MNRLFLRMLDDVTCGDCIDVMDYMPARSVDFILTDPPYLVRYRSRQGERIANDDNPDWIAPAFAQMHRVLKDHTFCVSFYGWNKVDLFMSAWRAAGFSIVGHIVFRKAYASSSRFLQYRHEQAYLLAKGRPALPADPLPDVLEWTYTGNRLHPTQKSTSILKPLIQSFSKPGDVVLDPFCGSGSTLAAASDLGRRFIGIDLDARHHRTARRRVTMLAPAPSQSDRQAAFHRLP